MKIRDGEKLNGNENETTIKTTTKTTTKMSKEDLLIKMIQNNPQITMEEMSEELGISVSGVRYYIKKLKKEQRLIRVGSAKKGHWDVKMCELQSDTNK